MSKISGSDVRGSGNAGVPARQRGTVTAIWKLISDKWNVLPLSATRNDPPSETDEGLISRAVLDYWPEIANSHAIRGGARFWDYVWDGLLSSMITMRVSIAVTLVVTAVLVANAQRAQQETYPSPDHRFKALVYTSDGESRVSV